MGPAQMSEADLRHVWRTLARSGRVYIEAALATLEDMIRDGYDWRRR